MAAGDRIKLVRIFKGFTQKELGLAVGFEENMAISVLINMRGGLRTQGGYVSENS